MYAVSIGVLTNLDCSGLNLWGEAEDGDGYWDAYRILWCRRLFYFNVVSTLYLVLLVLLDAPEGLAISSILTWKLGCMWYYAN